MKKTSLIMAFIAPLTLGISVNVFAKDSLLEWKSADGTDSLKLGGLVRLNQRYESWDSPNRGIGKLDFDIFRIDLKGTFDDAYLNASYIIQDQEKHQLKRHMLVIT